MSGADFAAYIDEASQPRLQRAEVDYAQLRPVHWVLEGFIASGEVHTFAGQPGCGKTTLFAALSLVVAGYGRQLGSNVPNDRPRRVVIVSEHVGQFEQLMYGYARRYDLPAEELKGRVLLYGAQRLRQDELRGELVRVIRENSASGEELPLLILDTASASFDLQDENANSEVGAMLAELKQCVNATGAPVWVITHAAKALGRNDSEITPRGASAYIGDVHGTGSVFRDPNLPSWVFLRSLKNRAVRRFEEIGMQTFIEWHEVLDERGIAQQVGIRLGVPETTGESDRQSAAAQQLQAERSAAGLILRVKAQGLLREVIAAQGHAALWSGTGPSRRPADVAPAAAVTIDALKERLGIGSTNATEMLQHLREWAQRGELDLEQRGAWLVLRNPRSISEESRGIPEESAGIPSQRGKPGAAGSGGLSAPLPPPAPNPVPLPSSPRGILKGEEGKQASGNRPSKARSRT